MNFIGMADYQFQFDKNDNIAKLRYAMQTMDGEFIVPARLKLYITVHSRRCYKLHHPRRKGRIHDSA